MYVCVCLFMHMCMCVLVHVCPCMLARAFANSAAECTRKGIALDISQLSWRVKVVFALKEMAGLIFNVLRYWVISQSLRLQTNCSIVNDPIFNTPAWCVCVFVCALWVLLELEDWIF